ncbi:hypothetical protein BGW42_006904, partial [Actinomortierella wolfii]
MPPKQSTLVLSAKLGAGAYGTVYKGRWGVFSVAAKKFHVTSTEASQLAIQREIDTLRSLTYRHIIQFYDTTLYDGHLVLLTDLAEGGSLALAIRNGIQDWSTRERFAREISLGLAYIHSKGVLHHDLKSENVLLSHSMEVKLCDFGCATLKTTSVTKSTATYKGTIRWTAPEIFARKPKYSTKSDMYSFGMVMWEMAANCTIPFKDHLDHSVIISLVKEGAREKLPEDTPANYQAWVERCWHQDPSQRPEASEFVQGKEGKVDTVIDSSIEDTTTITNIELTFDDLSVTLPFVSDESVGEVVVSKRSMGDMNSIISHHRLAATYDASYQSGIDSSAPSSHNSSDSGPQQSMASDMDNTRNKRDSCIIELPPSSLLSTKTSNSQQSEGYEADVDTAGSLSPTTLTSVSQTSNDTTDSDTGTGFGISSFFKLWMAGLCQGSGLTTGIGSSKAFDLYLQVAKEGVALAQEIVAELYIEGQGVKQDYNEAFKWFTKAANQGDLSAQFNLGIMYDRGLGVQQSDRDAMEWYTKAAERGHAKAQFNLGMMYEFGQGVERNEEEAAKWYTKAAKQGMDVAQYSLALMYDNGT